MTDLNKLRSEFEELPEVKQWIERLIYGDNSEVYIMVDETEENNAIATWINGAWFAWKLKAKAQAVPEGYKLVPVELSENIAERLAFERVPKPRPENDPVWVEIAERAYKSNLLAKKWELVREYKILTEASESGAEG
ncbi:hypothetical protein OHV41_00195 [Acinetobacter baumannii]|nr:hypothetical protein [Acinetobacter baumannii]MDC4419678.1 hypothetical protein [Acinetobacter baumannii]MDC4502070.1 hypothetical protein [Acinetobacter baumannii]MDC4759931.1 hypothetical protein [Acinetobacter baumannii]MDC4949202.1 hypothetical protein [Acinetobacter baumannii]